VPEARFQYCDKTLYPRVHLGTSLLDPLAMVLAHIGMDHKDEALTYLERAYEAHSTALTALKADPIYDPLGNDLKFQDLVRRMHLAQ
jgi:hypothetical protein